MGDALFEAWAVTVLGIDAAPCARIQSRRGCEVGAIVPADSATGNQLGTNDRLAHHIIGTRCKKYVMWTVILDYP
jgi:hypothetical protein